MRRTVLSLLAGALLASAAAARAQTPQEGPAAPPGGGVHRHEGFFLQLSGGVGSLGSDTRARGFTTRLSGSGGQLSLAIGGSVAENLTLAGEAWGMWVRRPRTEVAGLPSTARDGSVGLRGLGAKLTYYFVPANVYLTATPSIATLTTDNGRGVRTTMDRGLAFRLAIGKEWWVSEGWALGGSFQYARSWNRDPGPDRSTWTTSWLGIAVSATYD